MICIDPRSGICFEKRKYMAIISTSPVSKALRIKKWQCHKQSIGKKLTVQKTSMTS